MSLAVTRAGSWNELSIGVSIPQASFPGRRGRSRVLEKDGEGDDQTSVRWAGLMTKALRGDTRAYAQFLRDISPFVKTQVRRYHADPETVEDVLQDTLLTIHRVRHTYEEGRSLHAWIAAIARRRSIDAHRSSRRHRVGRESIDEIDHADEGANYAEAFAYREQLAVAMRSLPASQREAMRLVKVEEYSLEEASRLSGQSALALKSLIYRAMRTLRSQFGGGGDGE